MQIKLPSVPSRVIGKAEASIKKEHVSDNWENVDQLLPPDIRYFSKEN